MPAFGVFNAPIITTGIVVFDGVINFGSVVHRFVAIFPLLVFIRLRCENVHVLVSRLQIPENPDDRYVDRQRDERALHGYDQRIDGDLREAESQPLVDGILDAEEHDIGQHRSEDERETARQPLDAGEGRVRGTCEDAHPEVFVAQLLQRLHAQHVLELVLARHVQLEEHAAVRAFGRQPAVADEVPRVLRVQVADRDLVKEPETYSEVCSLL